MMFLRISMAVPAVGGHLGLGGWSCRKVKKFGILRVVDEFILVSWRRMMCMFLRRVKV